MGGRRNNEAAPLLDASCVMVTEDVPSRTVATFPPSLSSAVLTELSFGLGGVTDPGARGELGHVDEGHLLGVIQREVLGGWVHPDLLRRASHLSVLAGDQHSGSILPSLPDVQVQLGFRRFMGNLPTRKC